MKRIAISRQLAPLAIGVLAYALSGCSVSFSTGDTIDQSDLVKDAQNFISQQLTSLPPTKSVSCPDDVDAKVGTTFTCTATLDNGQKITIPLRVASVNDNGGNMTSNPKIVDQALAVDLLYEAAHSPIKSVACPTGVPASPGKTFDCTADFQDGSRSTVTIRVQSVNANGTEHLTIAGAQRS